MTNSQWSALNRMTTPNSFSSILSIGKVTLTKVKTRVKTFPIYKLEYPSYCVELYRDSDINGTDLHYLRYLYNEYIAHTTNW
jgi:hypothetical protein